MGLKTDLFFSTIHHTAGFQPPTSLTPLNTQYLKHLTHLSVFRTKKKSMGCIQAKEAENGDVQTTAITVKPAKGGQRPRGSGDAKKRGDAKDLETKAKEKSQKI